tara:strand:- start:12201 stop:14153 length:1953 start_codon:yes stop_codon:yes gene_type:complete
MKTTQQYKSLFSPFKINELEFKNRILLAPMGDNLCNKDGSISKKQEGYFLARAQGGCAGIILGSVGVSRPSGQATPLELSLANNNLIGKYKKFVKLMHKNDCKVIAQIKHGGSKAAYAASIGVPFLVPSLKEMSAKDIEHGKNMVNKLTPEEMNEFVSNLKGAGNFKVMDLIDIEKVVEQFKDAAERAYKANIDGIEIHAGHGYIISSFLSKATNLRTDKYGGSLKNRIRLLDEIIDAIRTCVPRNFPIIVRLDGEEINIKDGLTSAEVCEIAKHIESKIDAIHVSSYANPASGPDFTKAPLNHKKESFTKVTNAIKNAVQIPIIAVGRIEPERADKYISEGKFNFLAMGRKLLADPNLPNKLKNNEKNKIKPCQYSYECVSRIFLNGQMVCASDVGLGKRDKNYSKRKLVIIGAGPAGLELALQGAKRNIEVAIFERQGFIGGNLIGASLIYEPYKKLLNYYQASIKNKLIDLNLNTEISSDDIKTEFVDNQKVVVATGGVPSISMPNATNIQSWLHPFIEDNNGNIDAIKSALEKEKYKNFAILGTNTIQLHLAAFLRSIGVDVSLVRTKETIGKSMPVVLRWKVLDELENQVPIISENAYFEKKFDITLDSVFESNSDIKELETIGDSKHGLAYIPQTAKDAVGFFK